MLSTYTWPRYTSPPAPELGQTAPRRHPLVVVGAGPVGLTMAIDAALHGHKVLLLDKDNTVSIGSRGVCYAKRTLEIFDRLGVGDAVLAKGVTWNVGRSFHREREVFSFNLLAEAGHRRPGMANLQQYHLEQILVERAQALAGIDLRWQHKVVGVTPQGHGALIEVESPEGNYSLRSDWLIAADGAGSPIRQMLGLEVSGKVFHDRFLIADVLLSRELFAAAQTERRFWFDPPFHRRQSALLHRQADAVWRMDFQLGADADPELEKQPQRVQPRIRAALDSQGFADVDFELEWVSVYTFQCRRMARFRHGPVLFVGDAAHQVSPFGARGANSGVQDADNLAWKLGLVLRGLAGESLLDSYDFERGLAADENLLNSTRSTDFMTPRSPACEVLREAVLGLAAELPFARALVNSGRLSVPSWLVDSPLNTPDGEPFDGWMVPGAPMDDAPVLRQGEPGWLLQATGGGFVLMFFGAPDAQQRAALERLSAGPVPLQTLLVSPPGTAADADAMPRVEDLEGLVGQRYDAHPGSVYLLRPDQHVAARWRHLDAGAVGAALNRALSLENPP